MHPGTAPVPRGVPEVAVWERQRGGPWWLVAEVPYFAEVIMSPVGLSAGVRSGERACRLASVQMYPRAW